MILTKRSFRDVDRDVLSSAVHEGSAHFPTFTSNRLNATPMKVLGFREFPFCQKIPTSEKLAFRPKFYLEATAKSGDRNTLRTRSLPTDLCGRCDGNASDWQRSRSSQIGGGTTKQHVFLRKNAVSFSSGQLPYLVHVKHFYAIEYISHLQTARGGKLSARTEGRYM